MRNTLDDILSDLDDDFNLGDVERYRHRVAGWVRYVFRRIGFELVGFPFTEKMTIAAHYLQIPPYALSIEDGGSSPKLNEFVEISPEMHSGHQYAFMRTTTERAGDYVDVLFFPNMPDASVYVRGVGLMRDERGQVLINEDLYEACYEYCTFKILERLPQHPRRPELFTIEQRAKQKINEARADLVPDTTASRRRDRIHLGGVRNQIN